MKRWMYLLFGITVIISLILSACTQSTTTLPSSTTQITTTTAAATTSTKPPTSTTPVTTIPKSGGILNIASRYALTNVGGAGDYSGPEQITFLSAPTERLFRADNNGAWIPELAESWDISADGLTVTFHLRKGVKFQDGTDFNAAAVKYSYDYRKRLYASYWVNVSSVDAVDDSTLRIVLKNFDANLFTQLAQSTPGQICSPTALMIASTNATIAKDHVVGTGPFTFDRWQRNTNLTYKKFTGYWQTGLPYIDGVNWIEFADSTSALMALKSGQIQIIDGVSTQDAGGLKAAGYQITMTDWGMQRALVPDSANPDSPFANEKVREAVEWAIDRKAIAKSLDDNYTEACTQYASSKDAVYDPVMMPPRVYNVQKAKELLTAAGYPNGFKTNIYAQTNENKELLVAIQGYLKDAGIEAEIQMVDATKMASMNKEGWNNGLLLYVQGNFASSVSMSRYFSIGTYYKSAVKAPEMLKLITDAIAEPNFDKRIAIQKQWQKYMYDNAYVIPLYTFWMLQASSPKVHDCNWGLGFTTYYNWASAWIEK